MQLNLDRLKKDFKKFSTEWENTIEYNEYIYNTFGKEVDNSEILSNHFNIITEYKLAYGEKPFMYLWPLIVSQIPEGGKFLEIGVYKGSILALTQTVSKHLNLNITSYGLTPLSNAGDKYSNYDYLDYGYYISFLYHKLEIDINDTIIIEGLSTDENAKEAAKIESPYDVVYIDGGHDYETVINDIELCNQILKPGGILVMDDASSELNLSKNHPGFTGHPDVAKAIIDDLDNRDNYKHLFACGHNRVWKKLN
jgi:SAM-dependent methyltransferase